MTEWFEKKAGTPPMQKQHDGSVATFFGGDPDWVRLPPELGGVQERVQKSFAAKCPSCGAEGRKHMKLETFSVAECDCRGFLWYRGGE